MSRSEDRIIDFIGGLAPHDMLTVLEEAWSNALDSQKAGFAVSHRSEIEQLLEDNPE